MTYFGFKFLDIGFNQNFVTFGNYFSMCDLTFVPLLISVFYVTNT